MTTPLSLPEPWAPVPAPATRPPLLRLAPPLIEGHGHQEPLPVEDADVLTCPAIGVDPDAERAALSVTRALAEVIAGRRPVTQVRPALVPRVAQLVDHLMRGGAAQGMRLAGVRLQSPRVGIVEATARLASPTRSVALAVRIEKRPRRWVVTVLEAGLAADGRRPAHS